MPFLSVVCAAIVSSGRVEEIAPYNARNLGLEVSTALCCSMCEAGSLVRCCCVSPQTSAWISVNLASAVGGGFCHKWTEVFQL